MRLPWSYKCVPSIDEPLASHHLCYFQQHPGKLHICVDGWTSPNVISFLGVTVQRVVGPSLEVFILDFIKLTQGHTGKYLEQQLTTCLKEYGIEKKVGFPSF